MKMVHLVDLAKEMKYEVYRHTDLLITFLQAEILPRP